MLKNLSKWSYLLSAKSLYTFSCNNAHFSYDSIKEIIATKSSPTWKLLHGYSNKSLIP